MAKNKFIDSLLAVTKTRAEMCWKYANGKAAFDRDRILYNGKARAYEEMTELLESLNR